MPPPRLSPAQRTFGIGVTPTYDIFRPPEGMELDPAYSPVTRQQQAAVMNQDLQREAFRQARDEQQYANEERMAGRQIQAAEQQAIEAMRGKSPEEIPNILAQFPELARSKNLGGFTNFAQAVTPSAGQRTLAPSLRAKLPPAAIPHFNKRYAETGDALDSNEYAQRALDHEKFVADVLPDVMAGGGTMEDLQKIRDQIDLGPIERAAFRESWKRRGTGGVKDDHRAEAMKDSIRSMYEALPDTDDAGKPLGIDEILRQRAEIADKAYRTFYPEKFKQEAVAQPVATGGQAVPVAGSQLKEVLGGKLEAPKEAFSLPNEAELRGMINAPEAGEDDYIGLIENTNVPINLKKEALEKFRAFAINPPPLPGSTLGDVLARKDKIAEQLKRAEKEVRLAPERDKYIQAWNAAKQDTAKDISRFAKSIGADDASVINSLAKNEIVEIPGRFNPETEDFKWNVRDLFYDDQAKRLGVDARRIPSLPNERLEPFQKSEFAKELGVESFTLPGFRRIELGSGKKSYDDVLNAYLQEKAGNAPTSQVGLPRPSSPEEAAKLPPGTKFLDPNGKIKEVPLPK